MAYLSVTELAQKYKKYGTSKYLLGKLVKEGKLDAHELLGVPRISEESLRALLKDVLEEGD